MIKKLWLGDARQAQELMVLTRSAIIRTEHLSSLSRQDGGGATLTVVAAAWLSSDIGHKALMLDVRVSQSKSI